MTFSTGNTFMDAYVDFMADQLIASTIWAAVDSAFYPSGATPAKRVITDGVIYIFLQRIVTNGNSNSAGASASNGSGQTRFNEIKVSFSTGYNTGTHLQTGTVQDCGIPLESWNKVGTPFNLNNDVGSGNKGLQHFTWVDANGSICGVISSTAAATTYDYISFYCLEYNTSKLYADGFSNVFWTCFPANNFPHTASLSNPSQFAAYFGKLPFDADAGLSVMDGGGNQVAGGGNLNRPIFFHPFSGVAAYDEPWYAGVSVAGASGQYFGPLWQKTVNAVQVGIFPGFEGFKPAMRSQGDSKVYFQFPVYSANRDVLRRSPAAQTPFWFLIGDPSFGVNDGDLIQYTAPGPVVQEYLVKRLVNQETVGGGSLQVAIRHA